MRAIAPLLLASFLFEVPICRAGPATTGIAELSNVPYKAGEGMSEYEKERCKLDAYLPKDAKGFATLVWFHGGGLTGGSKDGASTVKIARSLAAAGLAVVVPNYRLSPKVKFPAYIEDSAAALAWTQKNISDRGGDVKRIFIGGHSAGGYLTLMLGLDARYLRGVGVEPGAVAGFIPVSGQTMTHYTVRGERGGTKYEITADEAAPVHFAREESPPFLVLYADRDMPARAEENMYFVAVMKAAGNKEVQGVLVNDRTHGSIASKMEEEGDPARDALLRFVQEASR
jgi:acetyl esterase/lipase